MVPTLRVRARVGLLLSISGGLVILAANLAVVLMEFQALETGLVRFLTESYAALVFWHGGVIVYDDLDGSFRNC